MCSVAIGTNYEMDSAASHESHAEVMVKRTFIEVVKLGMPTTTRGRSHTHGASIGSASDSTSIRECSDLTDWEEESCPVSSPGLMNAASPTWSPWRAPLFPELSYEVAFQLPELAPLLCATTAPTPHAPWNEHSWWTQSHAHGDLYWQGSSLPVVEAGARVAPGARPSVSAPSQSEMSGISQQASRPRTTVMLRGLPPTLTRSKLLDMLDAKGFFGRHDFIYLPVNFSTSKFLGYALVNMITSADAESLFAELDGCPFDEERVCSVGWSDPHQGLEDHVERYRNSPVMHANVPDEWKPIVLANGVRVPFPTPSKPVKAPKLRKKQSSA